MKTLIFLSMLLIGSPALAQPIKLVTEEYPPYAYRQAGGYKGASVEMVELVMKKAEIDYSLEMMPWARALILAETEDRTCVFTTVHNKQRDKRFKWVEPLRVDRALLIRKAGSGVNPKTIEEATRFVVGTQRDDFTADLLRDKKFIKIDLTSDFNLTLRKLLNDRIALMPISEQYFQKLKRDGIPIEMVMVLSKQIYSVACNKGVPDQEIARMQATLDGLIRDGTQDTLYRRYGLGQQSD